MLAMTASLLVGVAIGAIVSTLAQGRLKAEHIQIASNLAQALSVLVAVMALMVTTNIATNQNGQQKRQYTRDYITSRQSAAFKIALDKADEVLVMIMMGESEPLNRNRDSGLIQELAFIVDPTRNPFITYIDDIDECIDRGVCDEELAAHFMCVPVLKMLRIADLSEKSKFFNHILKGMKNVYGEFFDPDIFKQQIDLLYGNQSKCQTKEAAVKLDKPETIAIPP